MEWLTLLKGAVIGGIILFFWNGLAQNLFPWGIKSVREINAGTDLKLLKTEKPTEAHSDHEPVQSGMFYLRSEDTAALVAAKPGRYYSMSRFLAVELVTQSLVATALTVLLSSLEKLMVVALAALLATFSIDLQYWNWWGFSTLYTVGVAFNRLVDFLLVGWILTRFIL